MPFEFKVHRDNSLEPESCLVSKSSLPGRVETMEAPSQPNDSARSGKFRELSSKDKGKQDKVCRLAAYWQSRPEMGRLSSGAITIVQSSWAKGTEESYGLGFRY